MALAMVTQGAMPVFAQNEGAEGIETAADAETAKILCKHDFEAEEEVKVIMRIKIIFHITRMDDVSDVLKKAEELKKENPHTEISIEVLI